MKNGIIVKGVAYESHKRSLDADNSPLCKKCDLRRRCSYFNAPCNFFADKDNDVYFKKINEK